MAEGHGRDQWGRLSVLCAMIGNTNRDPRKGRAFKPSDFNPYEQQPHQAIVVSSENIDTLKQAFMQQQGRKGF